MDLTSYQNGSGDVSVTRLKLSIPLINGPVFKNETYFIFLNRLGQQANATALPPRTFLATRTYAQCGIGILFGKLL